MTNSTPWPEPAFPALESLSPPSLDAVALQPQLLLMSGLLSRLLERLEAPSGETDQQIAEVLSQLSALTQNLARTAEAMERIVSHEGPLGQIGAEVQRIRARQEIQERQLAVVSQRTAMILDWLAGEPTMEGATGA
jgi:predicted  nucleic acid-binding Zn-ribbon protein